MPNEQMQNTLSALRCELKGYPQNPRLLAVSKRQPTQAIRDLYQLGQRDFGENRLQELEEKAAELADLDFRWHFIGHLQSKKVKALLQVPGLVAIHSIDSIKLMDALAKHQDLFTGEKLGIFLQINSSGEVEKGGMEDNLEAVAQGVTYFHSKNFSKLHLQGLMTMGSIRSEDFEASAKECFEKIVHIRAGLSEESLELSMGMSQDYKIALQAGADWIRLGTMLFGSRD